jgi:hypothetical protein
VSAVDFPIADAEYRALDALGSTDVNRLLKAPALYRWHRDNPEQPSAAFDLGSAVHSVLLGGRDVVAIDAPDWRSTSARAERDRIRDGGGIPLLAKEYAQASDMAAAVAASTDLLDGQHEVPGLAEHDGVPIKGKADVLHPGAGIVDLKTTASAHPDALARSILTYGYHVQAAHYLEVFAAGEQWDYLIVAVEKAPPYLVTTVLLDETWIDLGRTRCHEAYETWTACAATDTWPGYAQGVVRLPMPAWATRTTDLEIL